MALGLVAGLIGGSLLSGLFGAEASDDAADAQRAGSRDAIAEQRRQLDVILRMLEPQRQLGYGAISDLGSLYGYSTPAYQTAAQLQQGAGGAAPGMPAGLSGSNPGGMLGGLWQQIQQQMQSQAGGGGGAGVAPTGPGVPTAPSLARFYTSPDYNFRRTEGTRGIEQSAAARGGALSGNTLRGLNEFNSNLAAGEFGNYFNRQAALAGIGQTATGQAGNAGLATAANIGNAQMNAGASRASGILGRNAAIAGGITQGYENWLYGRPWRGAQTPAGRGGSWG